MGDSGFGSGFGSDFGTDFGPDVLGQPVDPDRGCLELGRAGLRVQVSRVSTLVSTWSGKWSVKNASPGRNDRSRWTPTVIEPRRELTCTSSPSATPSVAMSSGERPSISGRRRGEA